MLGGSNTAVIRKVGTIRRAAAKSYDNDNAISAAVGSEPGPVV